MDDEDYTVKNEVISGSETKFCSGETGQESTILQPQTGKRRRRKSRKIGNKNIQEVSATASGNDLSCSNTDSCDDKETIPLELTKSVEDSGMNTKTEINLLDGFLSQSSGDNNNQDISDPSNAQYFDAYDNILPSNEHLVQQQITGQQICNCTEFSHGGETLCAWCIVTEDSQSCGTQNSWQDMGAREIELETSQSSGNQEFSYGIERLEKDSYALPLVSFGSNEVLERCPAPIDSPINTILFETKNIEDMNDGIICSSNQQDICSSYIDHTKKSFEINPKYNDDNNGFYEKECDEPTQLNIIEYADGYYDSSGVYCFASLYDSNKEAQCNPLPPTLSASAQEMTTDFFDAHSSEHFISIPTQAKCIEPVSTDETYRFPADYEHVSSNLGNTEQQEQSDNYERYINNETNGFNVFRESSCQNNEFINNKHLIQGIDELLLNKEECINTVEAINPQYFENVEDTGDPNTENVQISPSFKANSSIYENYRNEELDVTVGNIFSAAKAQYLSLNTPTESYDTTWASTVNSGPTTQNNTIDLKIVYDNEESLSPFNVHNDESNYSGPIKKIEEVDTYTFPKNTDIADKIDTITVDASEETTASMSFVPENLSDSSHDLPYTQEDSSITSGIGAPLKNEERTSSFVTTHTLNDIQEAMQTELSDSCDVVKESQCVNGITLESTDNLEMNDIQTQSTVETESILSAKSVAEIIEFYNKLTDVEPEEISKELNRCVRVREVPASHNLKCEKTVFTASGTCLCVQENDMNNIFPEDTSHAELTTKIKCIKSETSTFSKPSLSEGVTNNSTSNSELHSRDLNYEKGEHKIEGKDNVDYTNKFDHTEEVLNSMPYNESFSDSRAAVGETTKQFTNHYITNTGTGNSNILIENKQSGTVWEDFNVPIETGNIVAPNTNYNFSDLASAFNSDSIKYFSKTFMEQNFISVDEDYDIDSIQIKHYNEGSEGMFWERNSDHVYSQDVKRCNNSEDKLNSDPGLSENLSLRSVERINDENNFTGTDISSPRSVNNSIPNVTFEDILYTYCNNMNKESSGIKTLIKTGVSVKELAKGFDTTLFTDGSKEPNFKRKIQNDVHHASPAKVEGSSEHEHSGDSGGLLSNEEKIPSTSKTNIKTSPNSKIDGLIKEFGEKGSFRRKRRNIDSDHNPEAHKCLCMSKSTNAIVTDDKSDIMRAINVISCQNADTPGKAHLYHHIKKHEQIMDCSSNVSVKDKISFFTNYPDPGKAEITTDEYTTYDDKAKCCKRNSLSNLCGVCVRKQKCSSAEASFIRDASKKVVTAEGQNELLVILTEPENGDVLETRSDNIFLDDRRAASVPFVVCSRPDSLIRLNKGERGNKFLLVLPDVHKLWMKTLPGGKGTISQLTEFIQDSAEDIDYRSAVSVKDLVARWNQNNSTNQ